MKICLSRTIASFSLFACALVAHDVVAAPSLANKEIYTEPHNLTAQTIVAIQLFVGNATKECGPILGEKAGWPEEVEAAWAKSNLRYTSSANDYLVNLTSNISLVSGKKAHDTMVNSIRTETLGLSDNLFHNTLDGQNRKSQCADTVSAIVHGTYDFAPPSPMAHLAIELAEMTEALSAKSLVPGPSTTPSPTK